MREESALNSATIEQKPPVKEALVFRHIRKFFPNYSPDVMFDVGANIGQSCLSYAQSFPEASIYAFEPVPATFDLLRTAVADTPSIRPWNLGLSNKTGTAAMELSRASVGSKIVAGDAAKNPAAVQVQTMRGVEFCREQGIERIGFLKIDTEGHDLNVLRGFVGMFDAIQFIQVEAAMCRYNPKHVLFRDFDEFLSAHGFHLFYLYEQTFEFQKGGRAALRRADPVFINSTMVNLEGLK